jgi:hypothetical protein
MTRRRDDKGRFIRVVDSEFGPVAAGLVQQDIPPFSSGEDAHSAAWDRATYDRARFNERRNESERIGKVRVKEAYAHLDRTPEGRAKALGVLTWATWERCQIEGLEDTPTIRVSFR